MNGDKGKTHDGNVRLHQWVHQFGVHTSDKIWNIVVKWGTARRWKEGNVGLLLKWRTSKWAY